MKLSKAERRAKQKAFEKNQNRKDRLVYAIPVIGTVLFLLTGWLKPLTIGYDLRYTICVIALPIVTGLILFITYRKKFLDTKAVNATKGIRKIIYSIILAFAISLFSFFTLGTVAIIVFETTNYNIAKKSEPDTITLPIDFYFDSSKRHGVSFLFEGKSESISLERSDVKKYESSGYKKIKLTIRKGIWNHYIVDDYKIIR